LVLSAVAVAAGILLGKLLAFSTWEAAWPIAAFAMLGVMAQLGESNMVGKICVVLALIFVGALAEAWHRPGPPPEIDAGSRETVILQGCVVEPTVFSPDREQFTLELDWRARARVSLALKDDDPPQRLDLRAACRDRRPGAAAAQLQQSGFVRLRCVPRSAGYFLDCCNGIRIESARFARALRIAIHGGGFCAARPRN